MPPDFRYFCPVKPESPLAFWKKTSGMKEQLGKFFLDMSKYMVGIVLLVAIFKEEARWKDYLLCAVLFMAFAALGFLFLFLDKKNAD